MMAGDTSAPTYATGLAHSTSVTQFMSPQGTSSLRVCGDETPTKTAAPPSRIITLTLELFLAVGKQHTIHTQLSELAVAIFDSFSLFMMFPLQQGGLLGF